MKRHILFSTPTETVASELKPLLFPSEIKEKVLAYMPCDGWRGSEQEKLWMNGWEGIAKSYNTELILIDNSSKNPEEEIEKLKKCNILLITGGNTYTLLYNLKKSSLFDAILKFAEQDDYVIAGWSAGAIIQTPSIRISMDENTYGLTDLTGLGFVDFEVRPHYTKAMEKMLREYRKNTSKEVKQLTDEEYLVV